VFESGPRGLQGLRYGEDTAAAAEHENMMAVLQRSAEGCPVEGAVPGLRGRTRANGIRGQR